MLQDIRQIFRMTDVRLRLIANFVFQQYVGSSYVQMYYDDAARQLQAGKQDSSFYTVRQNPNQLTFIKLMVSTMDQPWSPRPVPVHLLCSGDLSPT